MESKERIKEGGAEVRVLLLCLACGEGCGVLESLLGALPGIALVRAVKDADQALAALEREVPDAVLVHAPGLGPGTMDALGRLVSAGRNSPAVLALAEHCTEREALAALGLGLMEVIDGDARRVPFGIRSAVRRKAGEVEQGRALRVSEERVQDLEACLEASRAVLALDNTAQALSGLFKALKKKTGARSGYVAVMTRDGRTNDLVVMDVPEGEKVVWSCLPLLPWQEEAYRQGRLVQVQSLEPGPEGLPEWHRNLENVCFSPIIAEGRPEGMIVLAGKDGPYTARDLDAVEDFSALAATALKSARNQEDLHLARQEWENTFQAIGQSVVILSPDFQILDANQSTSELLGEEREKLLGRKCWEVFHGTDAPPPDCAMAGLRKKDFLGSETMEVKSLKGALLVSVTPVLDAEGRVDKIIHMATDISPLRRMQDELVKSKRQFEELFESMSSGVAIFEPLDGWREFVVRDLNRAAETIVRVNKQDVLGKWAQDAFPGLGATGLMKVFSDVARTGLKGFLPRTLYQQGGFSCWLENHVYPVSDGRIVFVFDDVSEKVRAEQQKTMLEVQLRQQQKMEAIGLLAGGVAHEINNPIHGVMSYAQLIMEDGEDPERREEYAAEIVSEAKRITAIVSNLLTFARQEEQRHSPAGVMEIVQSTLKLIQSNLRQDRIDLALEMEPDLPMVRCRSQQIQQVLLNLLTNARDALNERYPGYHPRKKLVIRAGFLRPGDPAMLRISVTDYGTGIEPALEERIFDPFFTTKPKEIGTGLGLAISHGIIREHKGGISMESRYGQFTTFHVDLPTDNGWRVCALAPDA